MASTSMKEQPMGGVKDHWSTSNAEYCHGAWISSQSVSFVVYRLCLISMRTMCLCTPTRRLRFIWTCNRLTKGLIICRSLWQNYDFREAFQTCRICGNKSVLFPKLTNKNHIPDPDATPEHWKCQYKDLVVDRSRLFSSTLNVMSIIILNNTIKKALSISQCVWCAHNIYRICFADGWHMNCRREIFHANLFWNAERFTLAFQHCIIPGTVHYKPCGAAHTDSIQIRCV